MGVGVGVIDGTWLRMERAEGEHVRAARQAGKGAARVWSRGFCPKAATPPGPPDRLLEPSWFSNGCRIPKF